MNPTVQVSLATFDARNDEYVLYFVEDGPWPTSETDWDVRLKGVQDRVLSAVDAAVDGGLAKKFPDSVGKRVRIQLDSPSGEPRRLRHLTALIRQFLYEDPTYRAAIRNSRFVRAVRVVTGHELGRFQSKDGALESSGAAIVCSHVANEGLPIMWAKRDAPIRQEDSGWQFLCRSGADETHAEIWSVREVLELEPTLLGLMEGPPGTQIVRTSRESAWEVVTPR